MEDFTILMHFLIINNGFKWTEGLGLTVYVKNPQQQPNSKKNQKNADFNLSPSL